MSRINQPERLHASVSHISQSVSFYHLKRDFDTGKLWLQTPDGPVEKTINAEYLAPTLILGMDAAQELFEELWAQGFRSVNDKGSSDRLDQARREHIDDLRKAAKLK